MIYARLRATAIDLLQRYGQSLTRSRVTVSDGAEPWDPPVEATDTATFQGFARGVDAQLVDGVTIMRSDLILIADANADIAIGDTVMNRTVQSEMPIPASGDLTLQKFILR